MFAWLAVAMKAMKTVKKVVANAVSLEVAVAMCGGRDRLERAIDEGKVVKKRGLYIFKYKQREQH